MSAETRWRKGPWFLEGNLDGKNKRNQLRGWLSSFPPAGVPIFELIAVLGPKEEIVASAHLIAAAPDLYDALEAAKKELEALCVELTGEDYNNLQINAALAKARG